MECTLSVTEAVEKFVKNIKKKYQGRRLIREEQLLCCKSEKLVRLELVERERLQASEQRGSGEDKVVRTPLAYADLFKVESGNKEIKTILIDGDAGVGKTTFCIAVCEDWANGKIFQEFELLLLLPLREQKVASAGSLLDLLKLLHSSNEVCELVQKYFEEDEGSILVIADGWDELGKEKREEGLFLYNFLFCLQYYSVSTLVTSRHSASIPLHCGKGIDRFAELRGFDKEHIVEFINSVFSSDQKKASELIDKLESNPVVESICSIPLNCVIICHLWQTLKGDLPTTMTGLYTKIILNTILHNIHKFSEHKNILSISTFDDVPESLQESWWLLCKFAFQTLEKDQLVFSDEELMNFFPQGSVLNDDILCFGLLQSSVSPLEVGCGRSFHFHHLTFQEYLAALFLVKQESDSLVHCRDGESFSKLTTSTLFYGESDDPFVLSDKRANPVVLRFFFGIIFMFDKYQSSIGERILTIFSDQSHVSRYNKLTLCHWAFEAHNDKFVDIIANQIWNRNLSFRYSLFDQKISHNFAAEVYVIANTPECNDMEIDFFRYSLLDNHLTALTNALADKAGKLQVTRLDLGDNKLTDRGVTDMFQRAVAAFQSLKYLDFSENMIRGEGVKSALATVASSSCAKMEFSLVYNPLDVPSLRVIKDALCDYQLNNLSHLSLGGSLSSDLDANAELILALGHCHNLKVLDLSNNNLHVPGGRALGKVIAQLSLQQLWVINAKLGDEGMAALALSVDVTCHIGELHLENNDIQAAGVASLADSVCVGKIILKTNLYLGGNPLCLEGAVALIKMLSSERFQAHCLDLRCCSLTTVGGSIIPTVSTFPNVSEPITCVGIREGICSNGIKANNIKELILSDNSFIGDGIHLLAGFMYLCPQLSDLHCCGCEVTSDDLKQLLSLLSQPNLSLKCWDLGDSNIDDDGVSALIEQLPMFPALIHVGISIVSDPISQEMHTNLKKMCEKRKKGACGDEAADTDSDVLALEDGAGTKISDQLLVPDSAVMTTPEPLPLHHEVQPVETTVAEGEESHGQGQGSSDSEDYLIHPSSPAAESCDNKASEDSIPVHVLALEGGATTEISSQHPVHDSAVMTTPESFPVYHEIQHVKTTVAEGEESHGQGQGSSDSGDYLTPPSAKRVHCDNKAGEDSTPVHVLAHEGGAGTEISSQHPVPDSAVQTAPGPQLGDIVSSLEEITKPHKLGIYLGIETYKLEKIEENYPRNVDRQMAEVIKHWLRNSSDCSWGALASAVEKMGGHGNLVKRLRDRHKEPLKNYRPAS